MKLNLKQEIFLKINLDDLFNLVNGKITDEIIMKARERLWVGDKK